MQLLKAIRAWLLRTVKNFTEGREGHEGKIQRSPPGSKVGDLTQPIPFPVEPGGLHRQQ